MSKVKKLITVLALLISITSIYSQGIDSTQVGKEYPYILPILGQKSYERGYKLPKPFGVMLNSIFTKQNIVLENFMLDFVKSGETPDLKDLSDIIDFGPSTVKVLTANARADVWILPFLSLGGYYGRFTSETRISLEKPLELNAKSESDGAYWGFNVLAVAPLGPINLGVDYSWSWSQNELLDKPVLVNVAGVRFIKNWGIKNKSDMFVGAWAGAQFQFLDAGTVGNVRLADVIDVEGGARQDLDDWYGSIENPNELHDYLYNKMNEGLDDLENTTVHYQFDKRLERNWNFIVGGQWQINRDWQIRTEAGFLPGKYQVMISANYRFGF
ncbi:hypothetical protein [Saccharicrinis aurantiacus]|uniref:hypothetical protein n=1 Tax=Saccharicrinis aurantiacus TaxID=1849719 RepID=UPI00094FC1A6|nr:hypothetical protein [Saccharicrinis aurantiacus]